MALQGTSLDYRPPRPEDQYDPEVVAMMKQLGIWHPAMNPNPNSKQGAAQIERESQIMAHILGQRENQKFREEGRNAQMAARRDALSEAELGRNERAATRAELTRQAMEDRKIQGLVAGINSGVDQKTRDVLTQEYLKSLGISNTTPTAGAKTTTGEYGPGGATKAVETAPSAPTGVTTPPDFIANTPAGYDYNLGTGQYVPKSAPGFINGLQINPGETLKMARDRERLAPKPEVAQIPMHVYTDSPPIAPAVAAQTMPVAFQPIAPAPGPAAPPVAPPTANFNVHSGFTPGAMEALRSWINLPYDKGRKLQPSESAVPAVQDLAEAERRRLEELERQRQLAAAMLQ